MRTILNMADPLPGLLAPQHPVEGEPYRLMRFVVRQPVEEGLLLYHVMTKALILLDHDEAEMLEKDPASVQGLVENWFAVPCDHDDTRLAMEVRAVGRMLKNPVKGLSSYTILTTTDCNARCFYCYEKGRSRIPMSDETARAVVQYIIRNRNGNDTVKIRWFGGEPLYNKKVITQICTELKEAGVGFRSSMVSNGLLFDGQTVQEAIGLWNLKKIQITLDGTEKVYNRIKNFVNPEGSPFLKVLRNIRLLVDAGVKVNIRLNIDRHNADDLFLLADQLGAEFGNNPLVSVYSHSLFETCDAKAAVSHSDTQRRELSEKQKLLREKLRGLGLSSPGKLSHSLKLNRCMADNDSTAVILPDGHVGKCEHFTDSEWFSHVSSDETDGSLLASFKESWPELEACRECAFFPDCFRLLKCEEAVHCFPEEREEKFLNLRDQLLSYYRHHAVQD